MAETELIPHIDEDGLVKANADIINLKLQLEPLKEEIEKAVVKTQEDYLTLAEARKKVKDNQKKREWLVAPFKSIIATMKDRIGAMANVDDCKALVEVADRKLSDWRTPEKEASAEEFEQENKKRAKAGLPPIKKVIPNIPKVPGMPVTTRYHAKCDDFVRLLNAFVRGGAKERQFLKQFLLPNDAEMGKYARETKDDDAVMKAIPGSYAWHTD